MSEETKAVSVVEDIHISHVNDTSYKKKCLTMMAVSLTSIVVIVLSVKIFPRPKPKMTKETQTETIPIEQPVTVDDVLSLPTFEVSF